MLPSQRGLAPRADEPRPLGPATQPVGQAPTTFAASMSSTGKRLARHPPERCRPANSPPAASQADEAICLFDEPSDIRWSHPLAAESGQVIVGGPTGHRASLSDVDGHLMLAGLGEQVADWWYTNTLELLADGGLDQLRCIPSEHDADRVTHLQRAVDGQVERNGCPGRIRRTACRHIQSPHE
jgi:hypothetical protein